MKSKIFFAFLIVLLAQSQVSQAEPIFGIIGDLLVGIPASLQNVFNTVNNLIAGVRTALTNLTLKLKTLVGLTIAEINSIVADILKEGLEFINDYKADLLEMFNDILIKITEAYSADSLNINGLSQFIEAMKYLDGKVSALVKDLLAATSTAVKSWLAGLADTISSTLLGQLNNLADTIAAQLDLLFDDISAPICTLLTPVTSLPGTVLDAIKDTKTNPAVDLSTIQTTLNSTLETVGTTVNGVATQVQNLLSGIPAIVSNLLGTVTAAIPPGIPCLSEVKSAVKDLAVGATTDVTTCVNEVIDTLTDFGNQFIAAGQGITATDVNSLVGLLDEAPQLAVNSTTVLAGLCNALETCLADIVGGLSTELFATLNTITECITEAGQDLP